MNIYEEVKDFTNVKQLEKLYTKQLLNLLKGLQSTPWCDCGCWRAEDWEEARPQIEAIKQVLKTRPHVMNKKEAYEYRKARAQGKARIA